MAPHIGAMTTKLSVLDLVPIVEGGSISRALADAAALAAHAEALGYNRYWVAEHHGMPGIGGAATSVVLGHIGAATSHIRIGAGGIMLPNHAPLAIAEQFGTLDALYPGRIDLGLGRAPGSDQRVAQALRRTLNSDPNAFPRDIMELQAYFAGDTRIGIEATPGAGADIALWILGSSLYGAELAAMMGLPYAFASHFAPDAMDDAIALYRERFRPSATLAQPYVMLGFNICAADTAEEAELLSSSSQQSFVALRFGTPGRLAPPVPGYFESLPDNAKAMLNHVRRMSATGTKEMVAQGLEKFIARTQADEVIVASMIHDPQARLKSYSIAMDAAKTLGLLPAA